LFIFLLICSGTVQAQPIATASNGLSNSEPLFLEEQTVASVPFMPDTDPFAASLRIITALIIVIILAFAVSWFIQKKGIFTNNVFGRVIGIIPLDNRRFIYMVDVVGRILVLGVTEQNINLLCEVTDKDTIDSLRLQNECKPMPGMEKLFSFLKKQRGNDPEKINSFEEFKEANFKSQTLKNQEKLKKINNLLVKRNRPPKEQDK
jgi:flagellar protein FliO/FliZ